MNAAAKFLKAIAKALPAFANAPSPAHETVLPAVAHIAFAGAVAAGIRNAMTVIAIIALITRRFLFIDLQ